MLLYLLLLNVLLDECLSLACLEDLLKVRCLVQLDLVLHLILLFVCLLILNYFFIDLILLDIKLYFHFKMKNIKLLYLV